MVNQPRNGIVRSILAHGTLAALIGMTLGCGVSSPAGPTATLVTPVTSTPVAPISAYTVTAATNLVTPGGQLSVSWTASPGYYADWISLFNVGQPNSRPVWVKSTDGATSGTFILSAPIQTGQYEFRYLLEDEHDVARSSLVTVGGS
jgi:hypothetical protein